MDVIIYLQANTCPSFGSFSLIKGAPTFVWVAHSWGLPRSTQKVSNLNRHCGTFKGIPYSYERRNLPAVNYCIVTLTYELVKHERYNHHRLCEHGLSSICL